MTGKTLKIEVREYFQAVDRFTNMQRMHDGIVTAGAERAAQYTVTRVDGLRDDVQVRADRIREMVK